MIVIFVLLCPAKINLGLQVHHRREPDGYHNITSIFIPISFADEMQIKPCSGEDKLVSIVELPKEQALDYQKVSEQGDLDSNVVWQVLLATRAFRGDESLEVHLTKRIPTGGGLGGGSSDAGCLLRYIGKRYQIADSELESMAAKIGADVSFFLQEDAAFVSGTGEILESIGIGSGLGILCISNIQVNTAKAYSLLKRTLQAAPSPNCMHGLDINAYNVLNNSDWKNLTGFINDFEKPVFTLHPEIGFVKDTFLMEGSDFALMSGSGSSVFGLVRNLEQQEYLLEIMQNRFPQYVFVPFSFESSLKFD